MSIDNNSNERRHFIDRVLKDKKIYVNGETKQTDYQRIMGQARIIWNQILKNVANPFLRALDSSSKYDPAATQTMLFRCFEEKFSKWSKDELITMISSMHTEEMEKQIEASVKAGIHGPSMDTPI